MMDGCRKKALEKYQKFSCSSFGRRKSFAYKLGVCDGLRNVVLSGEDGGFHPMVHPYKTGTAENDAWVAGCSYGRKLAGAEG